MVQVYVTMYLNDCQRTAFYEGIGLNTKEFDMHVIIEVSLWFHNSRLPNLERNFFIVVQDIIVSNMPEASFFLTAIIFKLIFKKGKSS